MNRVIRYEYYWSFTRKQGFVNYFFEDGTSSDWISYPDAQEFQVITHMLSNEDFVYLRLEDGEKALVTGFEYVGEVPPKTSTP